MALKVWIGGAPVNRSVWTITIGGTWDDASAVDVEVTIGQVTLTLTVDRTEAAVDHDEIAANLHAMLTGGTLPGGTTANFSADGNGSLVGEFAECEFSVADEVVTILGPSDGAPVVLDTATDSNTGTVTDDEVVAGTGPHHYYEAMNWLGGTVPGANDDLLLDERATHGIRYDMEANHDYDSLTVTTGYQHEIGLSPINPFRIPYTEYRAKYLDAHFDTVSIMGGVGPLCLDTGSSTAVDVVVNRPIQFNQSNVPSVDLVGGTAASEFTFIRGDVKLSGAAEFIQVGSSSINQGQCVVHLDGVALDDLCSVMGGRVEVFGGLASILMDGGLVRVHSGAVPTLNVRAGTCEYISSGTVTNLVVMGGGLIDFSASGNARTVTNATLHAGAGYRDPLGTVTLTNGVILSGCRPSELSVFDIPKNSTIDLS